MAGNGTIRKDQVIDQGVTKGIDEATKSLKEMLDQYSALMATIKTSAKVIGDEVKSIDDLNKVQATNNQLTSDVEKLNNKLLNAQKVLNEEVAKAAITKKQLSDQTKQEAILNDKSAGDMEKLRAKIKLLYMEREKLKKTDEDYAESLKKNTKEIAENETALTKLKTTTQQQKDKVGDYKGALDKLIPGLGATTEGIWSIIKASLVFLATPIGWVIGALALAIGGLISYFKRGEEGQNKWNKILIIAKVIFENILDVLAKLGKALSELTFKKLSDDIKAIGDFFKNTFGNIIMGSITVFVGGLQKGFANIGLAWQKFKGIFVDNAKGIQESQDKISDLNKKIEDGENRVAKGAKELRNDIVSAYNSAKGAIQDYLKEQQKEIAQAKILADNQAKYDRDERRIIKENAILKRESDRLRADAEEEKLTNAAKSIELMEEADALEEKTLKNELYLAEQKAKNAKMAASFSMVDKDHLKEIAELEADVENKKAAFEENRRQDARKINKLRHLAFQQEADQLKVEMEGKKALSDISISENKRVLEDAKESYDAKSEAAYRNMLIQEDQIKEQNNLEKKEIEAKLKFGLTSQADADAALKTLENKKQRDIYNIKTEYKSINDKLVESEAKYFVESSQKSYEQRLKVFESASQKMSKSSFDNNMKRLRDELENQRNIVNLSNLSVDEKQKSLEKIRDLEIKLNEDAEKRDDDELKRKQSIMDAEVQLMNNAANAYNAIGDAKIQKLDSNLKKQELALSKEAIARKKNGEDSKKVDADIADKKTKLEQKTAIEQAKIKRKQAVIEKVSGTAGVGIDTAKAVSKSIAFSPETFGLPWSAFAIAQGIAQEIVIASKPLPEIPSFKKGTADAPGGLSILHGGELIELPTGKKYLTLGGVDKPISSLLPKHSKVTPNDLVMDKILNMPNTTGDAQIMQTALLEQISKELNHDKPVVQINVDETGFNIAALSSRGRIAYINNKYRGKA